MAIFTKTANYLKCRNYFEHVLGFNIIDPSTPGYGEYGVLCTDHNLRIAQNIWFLYGGALAWTEFDSENESTHEIIHYGEDNPPQEIEESFTLRDSIEFNTGDKCSFILDLNSVELPLFNRYFIGMKRLVPIENAQLNPNSDDSVSLTKDEIKAKYKNVIKFLYTDSNGVEKDDVGFDENSLNEKQPNMLKITTSYEYGDFGFKENNREYDVRQIGLLNHLCCSNYRHDYIEANSMLFNKDENTNLSALFSLSAASKTIPVNFNVENFIIDESVPDQTLIDTSGFFGILQFYLNSRANNRITYQTDYYNFILKFENKLKCSCTCDNCENN